MLSDLPEFKGLLSIDSHAQGRGLIFVTGVIPLRPLLAPPHDFDFTFPKKYRREKFSPKTLCRNYMQFFRHCYHAIRYGDWDLGWESYKDKPMFGFYHTYYDGNHFSFHCYKLWISAYY